MFINGFQVVRKSEKNFDKKGRGSFSSTAPQIGGLYYPGLDRMPWFDIDEDYYNNTLPNCMLEILKEIWSYNQDDMGIELCRSLDVTKKILNYSNNNHDYNEVIALVSDDFNPIKGGVEIDDMSLEYIGVDLFCSGYGSFIREGFFKAFQAFSEISHLFNGYGLLASKGSVNKYIKRYKEVAKKENLEPIDNSLPAIIEVEIYRVVLSVN